MSIQSIAIANPRFSPAFRIRDASRSAADFEQSLAQGQLRRIEAKEFLFAEGDPISHVYRIETGALALSKVLADGRRQVMGFAYVGDIAGLGDDREYTISAQAVKPTRVRCLSVMSLRQSAVSDPAVCFKLYEAMARELLRRVISC